MKGNIKNGVPPQFEDVLIYFQQKGISADEARDFFLFYDSKNWQNRRGGTYLGWKGIAHTWIIGVLASQPWLRNHRLN